MQTISDDLTRHDLLTIWGYLDVLTGSYHARALAAAERREDKLSADYTRKIGELEELKRKVNAAAYAMDEE